MSTFIWVNGFDDLRRKLKEAQEANRAEAERRRQQAADLVVFPQPLNPLLDPTLQPLRLLQTEKLVVASLRKKKRRRVTLQELFAEFTVTVSRNTVTWVDTFTVTCVDYVRRELTLTYSSDAATNTLSPGQILWDSTGNTKRYPQNPGPTVVDYSDYGYYLSGRTIGSVFCTSGTTPTFCVAIVSYIGWTIPLPEEDGRARTNFVRIAEPTFLCVTWDDNDGFLMASVPSTVSGYYSAIPAGDFNVTDEDGVVINTWDPNYGSLQTVLDVGGVHLNPELQVAGGPVPSAVAGSLRAVLDATNEFTRFSFTPA